MPKTAVLEDLAVDRSLCLVPVEGPEVVFLRQPDRVVYVINEEGVAVICISKPTTVVVPLFDVPEDLAPMIGALREAVEDHVPFVIDDRNYEGMLYSAGARVGLLMQGRAPTT